MDEERCSGCKGACLWDRNIQTCQECGLVALHFEGDLPEIIGAIDAATGGEE